MRRIKCAIAIILLGAVWLYAESEGYKEWLKRRDALMQDKSVERYYTFEDVENSKSVVKDLGRGGTDLMFVPFKDARTGEVFDDLKVIEGRWSEKKAVRLDRGWYEGPPSNIKDKKFTVEIWFRKNGPGSVSPHTGERGYIISSPAGWGEGWRIKTGYSPSKWLTFDIGIPQNNVGAKSDKMYSDGVWHHAAATWDGKDMKLYVDGVLAASNKYAGEYFESKFPFRIGFRSGGSVLLDVDEAVVYNRVLSAKEIEELGKLPFGVSEKEVFLKADDYMKEGNYEKARAEYAKLKSLPDYGRELALFNIAESYRQEKNYAGAHRTYNEIFKIPGLKAYYRIYGLFRQAEVFLEQKNYAMSRQLYEEASKTKGASGYHVFISQLRSGDTYRTEKKYRQARKIYEKLLMEQDRAELPHQGYRIEAIERLESIEGMSDGMPMESRQKKLAGWLNLPKHAVYVSPQGDDKNEGTKEKPFATVKRARDEVRKIKEMGMPKGGVLVYLRAGSHFLTEPLSFGSEDSGTKESPVIYRSYPGEEAKIVGGVRIKDFRPLDEPAVIKRLPEEAKGRVWVANLKDAGITDYGKLVNRGTEGASPAAMELIFNGKIMRLARWPNDGWLRIAGLVNPKGDYEFRKAPYQKGKFVYSDDRPERWKEEQEIWMKGYAVMAPFHLSHLKITSIDTDKKIIYVADVPRYASHKDPTYRGNRFAANHPYFVYNLLSELDMPGEFYIDRSAGKLYFYPPGNIEGSEIIGTRFETPLIRMKGASNLVFARMTIDGGRSHAFEIEGGRNNLLTASVIRNTGQFGIMIKSGWEHKVVGCDIYDNGEGGISLNGGDREKLIPAKHLAENNHIYRFNRFCGGYNQAVQVDGVGQRVSHNVIHDSPMQGIYLNANDHIVEFNEIHDVVHEGRELGALYMYGATGHWRFLSRGMVIRNNFFHHISTHSSPNLTHGLNAIHFDSVNGGEVVADNIFYRIPVGVANTYPDNRLENNIFIDMEKSAIGLSDRGLIFMSEEGVPNNGAFNTLIYGLNFVRYKQPPWSYRYPQLLDISSGEKLAGWSRNNFVERNVNTGSPFISIGRGLAEENVIRENWDDGENPLFMDRENMDFRFRPGSPVYGLTGCEPVPFEMVGTYEDELRANWPINRTREEIGKYYRTDWKPVEDMVKATALVRVSKALEYEIPRRTAPVKVDGKLDKNEWFGLDRSRAMKIEQHWDGKPKESSGTYIWLSYDADYLYIASEHDSEPVKEDMPASLKEHIPLIEIAIESQAGPQSRSWWMEDMPTGPVYIFWAKADGKFELINKFGMDRKIAGKIEASAEYRAVMADRKNLVWTCELRIPFAEIGINPAEVDKLCFNVGAWKRAGFFAWVATGDSIWRLENAGFIRFAK